MTHPELTDRLIVLNLPHPRGLIRELASNPQQQRNSQYARDFQQPDAAEKMTVEPSGAGSRTRRRGRSTVDALARSSMEGMLNYYKANYPRDSRRGEDGAAPSRRISPPVNCPVS